MVRGTERFRHGHFIQFIFVSIREGSMELFPFGKRDWFYRKRPVQPHLLVAVRKALWLVYESYLGTVCRDAR
jgi:hypothetical protein